MRIIVFGVSWFVKILANIILILMKKKGRVFKALAHLISISQKVHMVALNAVAIDLIPYSLITIFHTRELPALITWSSAVFLSLLLYDYCEIWTKGGKANVPEFTQNRAHETSSLLDLRTSIQL